MLSVSAKDQLIQMLDLAISNKELAGANLMILKSNVEIFYHEAGYASCETKKMITRDSIFRLYSMTKPVTAVAIMMLVEQGLIDLYDPVEKYLEGFRHQKVVVAGEEVAPTRAMNIMDLLSMTSGLLYGGDSVTGLQMNTFWEELAGRLLGDNPMSTQEAINRLGQIPLEFHPGSAWAYGTSADVLGAIVEVVTHKSYGEFLKEYLFTPLGMLDTDFYVPKHKQDRLVTTYERVTSKGGASLIPYTGNNLGIINAMDKKPAFESGGAGLASTIDDYSKFTQMLMLEGTFRGTQILRPKSVEYLTSKILTQDQQQDFDNWHTLAGHSYGNLMRVVTDTKKAGTIASLGEYGWDGWLGAYFANCPLDDLTILFMMQVKDAGTTTVTRKFRNIVLSDLCL